MLFDGMQDDLHDVPDDERDGDEAGGANTSRGASLEIAGALAVALGLAFFAALATTLGSWLLMAL